MSEVKESIKVLVDRLPEATKALDKLAKKAAKYGSPEIAYTVSDTLYDKINTGKKDIQGNAIYIEIPYVEITVTGEAPKVGDHEFVARIAFEDGLVLVDAVPGKEVEHKFRNADPYVCEHCNVNRYRKDVFVFEEDGKQIQVGRTCLKDYFGIDPKNAIWKFGFFKSFRDLEDEFDMRGSAMKYYASVKEILTYASVCIRVWGWASRAQAQNDESLMATSSRVDIAMFERFKPFDFEKQVKREIMENLTEDDEKTAEAVIEWSKTIPDNGNDYLYNLKTLLSQDAVQVHRLGMVASAVSAYNRAMEIETKKAREYEAKKISQFVGKEKERLRGLKVKVDFVRIVGGGYMYNSPDTMLVKFVTEEGNILSWFTGHSDRFEVGKEFIIDATVKRHNVYNGVNETQITRGSVKEEIK